MRIDELRETLHEHAGDTGDEPGAGRVASVHDRVRTARRRRRAAVAAAAVLAVAAGTAVPLLGSNTSPQPVDAPARLAGHEVPGTATATGFEYDYVRGIESRPGADSLVQELPASSEPRLVMWTSSTPTDEPALRLRDRSLGVTERSPSQGFDRYTFVAPGTEHRLMLSQRGAGERTQLAMAVFSLADEQTGTGNGAVTYRPTVGERRLLAARIGEPGEAELQARFAAPQYGLSVASTCYGPGAQGLYVEVESASGSTAHACEESPYFDPGGEGGGSRDPSRSGGGPGSPVHLRARLVDRDGDPAESPGVVIGFGAYASSGRTYRLVGTKLDVTQESDAHEWVWDGGKLQGERGLRSVTLPVQADDTPRLVSWAVSDAGPGQVRTGFLVDGVEDDDSFVTRDSGAVRSWGYVVEPGESPRLTLRVTGGASPRIRLGMSLSSMVR